MQLGEDCAFSSFGIVAPPQSSTHPDYEILAEVVGEGSLALELVHVDHDRLGFGLSDPDREKPSAALLLKNHDVGVGGAIEPEAHHFDFDELHENKLTNRSNVRRRPSSDRQRDPAAPT